MLLPVAEVRSIVGEGHEDDDRQDAHHLEEDEAIELQVRQRPKRNRPCRSCISGPGIRWIPTYRVSLNENKEKKTAAVSLQAELLNEAEDLDNVPVDIVVGVPNFRFRGTPSPLVLEATLRNALAEAAPDIMGNPSNSFSNAHVLAAGGRISAATRRRPTRAAQGVVNLPDELTAAGAQDLFVYNLPKITLGKGDRVAVPIFTADVPYRDLYTWDVRITKQDNDARAPSGIRRRSRR